MTENELFGWIQGQQATLDRLIADAADDFRNHYQYPNFIFDVRMVSREMYHLGSGKDLCYDRPAIGFAYSLWYHGKRINTFLRYYLKLILQSLAEEKIEIFDLGAGTGAVQWAIGVVYAALKVNGIRTPALSVINIDSSPFMLHYNQYYLWKHFVQAFSVCSEITTVYRINSWINEVPGQSPNIWLSASYLFDHSENSKEVAAEFEKLVHNFEPDKLLLLSALGKSALVNAVASAVRQLGYRVINMTDGYSGQVYSGRLGQVSEYRKKLQQSGDCGFSGDPAWNMEGLYGVVLVKKQGIFFPRDREKIDLYVSPEKNRIKIKLTREQEKAAEHTAKPTIIVGPAGCGKSVVLTQRVKNIVEEPGKEYNPTLKILVTTFNKDLVKLLGDWIEQLLDCPGRCTRHYKEWEGRRKEYSTFTFQGSHHPNIYVYHLDILPTQLGGLTSCSVTMGRQGIEAFHLGLVKSIVDNYTDANKLDRKKMVKILDPIFLLEEYHRIIYGWQCSSEDIYHTKERTGRGNNPTLRFHSNRRKVVWDIIYAYLKWLKDHNLGNFTMQRHRLLRKLVTQPGFIQFDHVLVDEIQDCTFADYTIFQKMLRHPEHLVLAGDLAQSIHLGSSVHFPTSGFDKIKLKGSFRLPFRISEAIKPLSQLINSEFRKRNASGETEIINPYKGSPPGARPIVVYGKNLAELADKVRDIFNLYKIFGFEQLAIFEDDRALEALLSARQVHASVEIILKSKGLEKPCVLWSTRVDIDTKNDVYEFVYTILTRTTSILMITICERVNGKFIEPVKQLTKDRDRVILWDEETIAHIESLHTGQSIITEDEDPDDTADVPSQEGLASGPSIEEF